MERAEQVWMIAASFNWDDLGAWDALARTWTADEDGNITRGESVVLGSRACIVLNEADDTGFGCSPMILEAPEPSAFQMRAVLSSDLVRMRVPSGLNDALRTGSS